MTKEERSSQDIERDIEKERSELSDTLKELGNRFTPDYLVREVTNQFREHGSDIGKSVERSVKENPIALAITGVGLGWLIFGQNRQAPAPQAGRPELVDQSAYVAVADASAQRTGRTDPDWARPSLGTTGPGVGEKAKGSARHGQERLSEKAQGAREAMSEYSEQGQDKARQFRDRLHEGTEHLSAEARDRVIAARERAIAARENAAKRTRHGASTVSTLYEEQPLIFGALALAVGAAFAGSMPRSRVEDEHLGEHSDWLMGEAERIYSEESEKTKAVVRSVRDEAENIVEEKRDEADSQAPAGKTAAQAAREETETAANRLKDAATDEAQHQDLGKPK